MAELDDLISQHRGLETEIAFRERELNTCRLFIDESVATGTTSSPQYDALAFLAAQLRRCRMRRERLRLAIARIRTNPLTDSASRAPTNCPTTSSNSASRNPTKDPTQFQAGCPNRKSSPR
ncbi:hypothetical protein GCT13_33055 [Paraburkholderia sp. CNPSo 3157]|uniref:Uncharacterized protein n=1 Tax=Paraburkholderia franconis TaxID=2654983 RepID=A0A7X1NGL6_9BURK|nr:hypothetical protein [Paraburkholderia franconis]MPW21572.1 hypothetical protein [Paraburkholderia franconis]